MNRIDQLFQTKKGNILSIYFTAGYPSIDSTVSIIKYLEEAGVDMIEIGIPFSDPLADGPVIQHSSNIALINGMSISLLFRQLSDIRKQVTIPVILMGYINPILKFGMENFCRNCHSVGIDGIILPDLPPEIFIKEYSDLFELNGLFNIFLISPQSENARIRFIDNISKGFIYMVSSSSTTGIKEGFSADQSAYFKRIDEMNLKNPRLTGFGISDNRSFNTACKTSEGAIIGSAFIKMLEKSGPDQENIRKFISKLRKGVEV